MAQIYVILKAHKVVTKQNDGNEQKVVYLLKTTEASIFIGSFALFVHSCLNKFKHKFRIRLGYFIN